MPLNEQEEFEFAAAAEKERMTSVPVWESALRGAGQGVTLGWSDEVMAGGRSLLGTDYEQALAEERQKNEAAKKANPVTYGVGEYGAPLLVPGLGQVRGAGLAAKIGLGAATGAAGGLGFTEGDKLSSEGALNAGSGAIIGGGAAYGADKLGNYLQRKFGKPPTIPENQVDDVRALAEKEIASNVDAAENVFSSPRVRSDEPEIKSSWQRLVGKDRPMPSYMGTADRETQRLADDVLQSTTIPGRAERQAIQPGYDAIEEVANKLRQESAGMSESQAGRVVRSGLSSEFEKAIEPAQSIYSTVESKFKDVPVRKGALKASLTNLQKKIGSLDPEGGSSAMIERLRSSVENINTVDQLRTFRTNLFKNYIPANLTDNQNAVLNKFYGALTRERNRSILNNYFAQGPKELTDLSREDAVLLLKELQSADKIWAETMDKFSSVLPIKGRRGVSTYHAVQDYLSDATPLEQYSRDLFDTGNVEGLEKFKGMFPDVFEVMRKRQLGQFVEDATMPGTGVAAPQAIIRQAGKIKDPAAADLVLGESLGADVAAAQKLQSAFPPNANPSGTATKLMEYNVLNPLNWAPEASRQLQYAAKRHLLHSGKTGGSIQNDLVKAAQKYSPQQVIQNIRYGPNGQGYAKMLGDALQRGNANYSATYFLLQQSDPEFRKLVSDEDR